MRPGGAGGDAASVEKISRSPGKLPAPHLPSVSEAPGCSPEVRGASGGRGQGVDEGGLERPRVDWAGASGRCRQGLTLGIRRLGSR